jgi:hypothetical protein
MARFAVIVMCPSDRAPPSTTRLLAASATKRPTEHNAESIRQHGLIQPITVRPDSEGFEIVAGARRFRAAQLAELFAIPARIVDIDDAQSLEWALVVKTVSGSTCILMRKRRDYASYCTSLLVGCTSWFADFPLRYLRSWLRSGELASGA